MSRTICYMPVFRRLSIGAALMLGASLVAAPNSIVAHNLARSEDARWRPVTIAAADGTRLAGWFFTPAQPNGGAVLLLHGVGDTRLGVTGQAEFLLRAGYAALLPDSRGHGQSGGNLVTYGVEERQTPRNGRDGWPLNRHRTHLRARRMLFAIPRLPCC